MKRVAATLAAVAAAVTSTVTTGWASTVPDTGTVETSAPFVGDYSPPEGYRVVVDDTNRLTIAVPDSWGDVDTSTFEFFGLDLPRIVATTDFGSWNELDTYDVPGVLYAAFWYEENPYEWYNEIGPPLRCQRVEPVPYDDGAFAGLMWQHRDCGDDGAAEFHVVVASPPGNEFSLVVVVQILAPEDQEVVDVALDSFNITPMATWPETEWSEISDATAAPPSSPPT